MITFRGIYEFLSQQEINSRIGGAVRSFFLCDPSLLNPSAGCAMIRLSKRTGEPYGICFFGSLEFGETSIRKLLEVL
jgi:hypothetical protein